MILAVKTKSLDPSERVDPSRLSPVSVAHRVLKTRMCARPSPERLLSVVYRITQSSQLPLLQLPELAYPPGAPSAPFYLGPSNGC